MEGENGNGDGAKRKGGNWRTSKGRGEKAEKKRRGRGGKRKEKGQAKHHPLASLPLREWKDERRRTSNRITPRKTSKLTKGCRPAAVK
jgi:hypothetical protein